MSLKENLEDLFDNAKGPVLDIAAGLLLDGPAGVILPGLGNFILSYKQTRMERNIIAMIQEIKERQAEFDAVIQKMKQEEKENCKIYFELMFDYIAETRQAEKIGYMVNGLLNGIQHIDVDENKYLIYLENIDQLNILDINILLFMSNNPMTMGNYEHILRECNLSKEEYANIINKLVRLGIVIDEKDIQIQKAIDELNKKQGLTRGGTSAVSFRFRGIPGGDFTDYGERFIEFFLKY